jgi:phosphate-selective porin
MLPKPQPPPLAAPRRVPLAGFSDGTAFLRSPDDQFFLFPNGRLQLDSAFFQSDNKTPSNTFFIKRARAELAGWIGKWVYFSIAGDFALGAPSTTAAPVVQTNLATTDDYVALAPFGTKAMLQVGQFDAPFTLENRTSDKYFDFMERSITVRAFGIPDNKEIGAMLTGYDDDRIFYYSAGVFNGDGQNYKNIDSQFDGMARAWFAPFACAHIEALHDVEIGGSVWRGDREYTLPLPSQTTEGGFTFLSFNSFNSNVGGTRIPVQLRQVGLLRAYAGELNAPIAHKGGLRAEYVWKHVNLSEENVTNSVSPTILGGANLEGWAAYAELWFWIIGDDRIIGDQQGVQPYTRWKGMKPSVRRDGLMLALRAERLSEQVNLESDAAGLNLGDSAVGTTKVTSYALGLNYWHSKRFRATVNLVLNRFGGNTAQINNLESLSEKELLFRLAIAL